MEGLITAIRSGWAAVSLIMDVVTVASISAEMLDAAVLGGAPPIPPTPTVPTNVQSSSSTIARGLLEVVVREMTSYRAEGYAKETASRLLTERLGLPSALATTLCSIVFDRGLVLKDEAGYLAEAISLMRNFVDSIVSAQTKFPLLSEALRSIGATEVLEGFLTSGFTPQGGLIDKTPWARMANHTVCDPSSSMLKDIFNRPFVVGRNTVCVMSTGGAYTYYAVSWSGLSINFWAALGASFSWFDSPLKVTARDASVMGPALKLAVIRDMEVLFGAIGALVDESRDLQDATDSTIASLGHDNSPLGTL